MNNVPTGLSNITAQFALRQQQKHQIMANEANAALASGRKDNTASSNPTDQILGIAVDSVVRVQDQARTNAANLSSLLQVGVGAIQVMQEVLSEMDALAAKVIAGDIGPTERQQINEDFVTRRDFLDLVAIRTRWNGSSLLTGGAGALTNYGAVAQADAGFIASPTHANSFAAGLGAGSKGMINGTVVDSEVVANGDNDDFDFSLTLQDADGSRQTFIARNITPTANGLLPMTSTSDSYNVVELVFAADVSDIDTTGDLTQAQTAFQEALGLNPGGTPATITGLSTAANNGVTTITAGTQTTPATYSIQKSAGVNSRIFLRDTAGNSWSVDAPPASATDQSITFANGVSVTLDNTYVPATAITQMMFDVEQGTNVTMTSQTGEEATDVTTIVFNSARLSDLNLSGANIASVDDARVASINIKGALDRLATLYSNLGAQQTNLTSVQENLSIISENLSAARSQYRDADIPSEVVKAAISGAMADVSGIGIVKATEESQRGQKIANQVQ